MMVNKISNSFPSFEEIYKYANKFVEEHPEIAWSEVVGVSEEGQDVMAIHVTDKTFSSEGKEMFLAIYGRHGNELGTRVAGIGLLEWLESKEALEVRKRQHVIIVPVANPDGNAKNKFHAPENGLSKLEENIISNLAETYKPDAVVDVHSLWYNDLEAIIDAHPDSWGEDDMIYQRLAMRMWETVENSGNPFIVTNSKNIKKVLKALDYNNFLCEAFYEKVHPLVFGIELNHFNRSPLDVRNVGVVCVSSLLKAGNQRFPWQKNSGYPNQILLGDLFTSIRARGKNASERRKSRVEIWKNRKHFQRPKRSTISDNKIKIETGYSGKKLSFSFDLTTRIRKDRSIQGVSLNGKNVHEFSTFQDRSSTYVSVPIKNGGKHKLTIITS